MAKKKEPMYDEVIEFAIATEQEAVDLYSNLAKRTKVPGAKIMFKELRDMEKGHKTKLERFDLAYFKSKKLAPVEDLKISDYLVDVALNPDSSYQDILLFASKRERAAFDLYSDLANVYSTVAPIKKIFEVLAMEEATHKLKLEREYDDVVYQEG